MINNEAIAADLSDICLPLSDRVKPTNQSFFLSRIMDFWCQWSKGSGGRTPIPIFTLELDWIYWMRSWRQGWEVRRGGGSSRIASPSRARKTGLSQMMSTEISFTPDIFVYCQSFFLRGNESKAPQPHRTEIGYLRGLLIEWGTGLGITLKLQAVSNSIVPLKL